MYEIQDEENRTPRAFLVGLPLLQNPGGLSELQGLVKTLEMEIAGTELLPRLEIHPAYGMGSGKAHEIVEKAKEVGADCIIMDWELDPTKQRNWEKLSKIPVFDRQEVIIRIFAARASTKEATLQVELARLEYSLPRLAHMYGDLARQRGGSYGSKGTGEKQLELDRRQTREKIQKVKLELEKVRRTRNTQRKRREKIPLPGIALCGYTNAGKSSLMNALTGADAFVENKLFATLDPLTRKIKLLPDSETGRIQEILLTDTVGFISNLPHQLIDAFKSTLEEAKLANLLLIVIDASDTDALKQAETVNSVLREIGAGEKKKILVLNKTDALESAEEEKIIAFNNLRCAYPEALQTSAKTGAGLAELKKMIQSKCCVS